MKREQVISNIESMTVREFGNAADALGITPTVLLAEYELQRDPSTHSD